MKSELTIEQLGRVFESEGLEFTLAEIIDGNDPEDFNPHDLLILKIGQSTGEGFNMATIKRIS